MPQGRIPLWLKIGWTVFVAVWAPLYWRQWGPTTFLWFCDVANILILVGLWRESSLILSWQAVSVLLFQIAYSVDVLGRAVLGRHLIGGTEWVFNDASIPPLIKTISVAMHVAAPPVLLWSLRRLGYDRRGLIFQIATAGVLLPICWFVSDPATNLNWVYKPFNKPQVWMAPVLYLLVCILGYAVLVFLPSHLLLLRFLGKSKIESPASS
jgi:hypothetical protein